GTQVNLQHVPAYPLAAESPRSTPANDNSLKSEDYERYFSSSTGVMATCDCVSRLLRISFVPQQIEDQPRLNTYSAHIVAARHNEDSGKNLFEEIAAQAFEFIQPRATVLKYQFRLGRPRKPEGKEEASTQLRNFLDEQGKVEGPATEYRRL